MWPLVGDLPALLDLLVSLTVVAGALAAAYKFRVFDVLGHRYRSEVWCASTPAGPDEPGKILFVGNFVIHNTGNRPLKIGRVELSLLVPRDGDRLIDSDRVVEAPLLHREFVADTGSSWFRVGAGERSIYPMRGYVDDVSGPLLFTCRFDWKHRGKPSEFVWLYDPRMPMTWRSEPTGSLPEAWDPGRTPPEGDVVARGRHQRPDAGRSAGGGT